MVRPVYLHTRESAVYSPIETGLKSVLYSIQTDLHSQTLPSLAFGLSRNLKALQMASLMRRTLSKLSG